MGESGVVASYCKTLITRKGFIEMLDKGLEEEQAPRVDERLARVVRIIVEQYDGDVKAFVESIRYRTPDSPREPELSGVRPLFQGASPRSLLDSREFAVINIK
jgi:hypothetical protein